MYRSILIAAAAVWGPVVTGPSPLAAQAPHGGDTLVVSLADVREMAVRANPELNAASWRPAAARGDVRTAHTLAFNPEASFDARSPGSGFASRYEAELGLELEVAGQQGLRVGATEAGYRAASRTFEDAGRLLLRDVERAYYRLAAAEERVALADEISELNARLGSAVDAQHTAGKVSLLDANLAGIEAARSRARALEARSARTTAALELGRLLGDERGGRIRTAGVSGTPSRGAERPSDAALDVALASRPDLLAATQDVDRAQLEARLARREAFPNLRVAALATREDPRTDPRFGVSVGMVLPLFNRNQGLTQRRQAEIAQAEQMRLATELGVRVEVEDALRAYRSAQDEVELLEAEMIGPIRQNQDLLEVAYREGKIDLASLLLLRNQLLDAELRYWDAWERRQVAGVDLAAATGEILEGVTLDEGGER